MKQSLRIVLASLLFCLCMGTVVMAHPPVAPCDRGPCPGMLSITAEQRAKYYAIMDEFAPKMQQINDQIFVKKNELEALKHAVQPDVAAVRVAATELTQLRAARRDLQKALDERLAKECGIVRPQKPIPGVDRPFPGPRGPHGPQGPHGFGPGPHGPHAGPGPHGPCPGAPLD